MALQLLALALEAQLIFFKAVITTDRQLLQTLELHLKLKQLFLVSMVWLFTIAAKHLIFTTLFLVAFFRNYQ